MSSKKKKVLVAMSGSIDSTVTAGLLLTQGYDVVGMHIKFWQANDDPNKVSGGRCCQPIQQKKVQNICDKLGIPLFITDASDRFKSDIVEYTVMEYLCGRKPNPCVKCNSFFKFDYLYQRAEELRCQYVATGHYAKVLTSQSDGCTYIYKPVDPQKDQTYLLFGLSQKQLQKTLMPLGDLLEQNVRKLAETFSINISDFPAGRTNKICLVGQGGYKGFAAEMAADRFRHPGHILDVPGRALGRHQGIYQHSVGDNKELNILLSQNRGQEHSYYALGFDLRLNAIIAGSKNDLMKGALLATKCNWIGPTDFTKGLRVTAKISADAEEAPCKVTLLNNDSILVQFDESQYAITPGQPIVFYQGEQLVGGGWIENLTQPVLTAAKSLKDIHAGT